MASGRRTAGTERGAPARTCVACGGELEPGALLCPNCGEPVVEGERKLVTVLFADLAGYTAMAAELDPEDVYLAVRPWMTAMRLIVEDHGGSVPQIMGDGFMAVFGVPAAHEDDAERAVRAGLELIRYGARLRDGEDPRFPGVHAGINSGEVLVGGSREASGFQIVGDPVNVASRLADAAAGGQLLVGEETRRLTRHAIRYGRRVMRSARGRREPVTAYEARAARPVAAPRDGSRAV